MYKTVYELSRDQFDELKSNFFWGEDTPEELKRDLLGRPALFPGDISDDIICKQYEDISFVDDDFCCDPGDPWTDSAMYFCSIKRRPDGIEHRQWLTGLQIRKYRNDGAIITGLNRKIPF